MPRSQLLITPALLLTLASCQGFEVLQRLPRDHGVLQEFDATLADAVAAARPALVASSLVIAAEQYLDPNAYAFYAEAGPFVERQGELVRLVLVGKGPAVEARLSAAQKMTTNLHFKGPDIYAAEVFTHMGGSLRGAGARVRYLIDAEPKKQ